LTSISLRPILRTRDLAFRIRGLGLKTYYAPFAEVVHFEGLSNGVSTVSGIKRYQAINELKFRQRWANVVRQTPHSDPDLAKDYGVVWRALVIDHKTPEPDKDAGSYAAIQEMRLLQALGFKLTFIAQNLAYMGNYTEALQRRGVECLYAPYQTSIEDVNPLPRLGVRYFLHNTLQSSAKLYRRDSRCCTTCENRFLQRRLTFS